MSESKNVAVDILRAEAARREVLIAELQREADALTSAADSLEGAAPRRLEAVLADQAVQAWEEEVLTDEAPKPKPPRERAFGPRVQHLSPADMPRPS